MKPGRPLTYPCRPRVLKQAQGFKSASRALKKAVKAYFRTSPPEKSPSPERTTTS